MSKKQIIIFIIISIIIIIFSIISISNNSDMMPDIITETIISEIFSYILVSLFPVKKDKKDRVILIKNLTIFIFIYAILVLLVLSFSEKNILYGILLMFFHIICFTGLLKKKKWAVFLYIPLNLGSLYFLLYAVNKNLTANASVLSLFFFILLPLIIIVSDLYNWKKLN